jgi:nitric oxide reductase activation protein
MATSNHHRADQLLVTQCRARDPAAWEQLYARWRERGQTVLPKALSKDAVNKALMDELIEDTLTNLFLNEGQLDSFLRSRRSLNDCLDYLLNRAVKHYYQERARHKRREVPLPFAKLAQIAEIRWLPSVEEELLQRLTPTEKKYFEWRRLPAEKTPPCPGFARPATGTPHREEGAPLALWRLNGRTLRALYVFMNF